MKASCTTWDSSNGHKEVVEAKLLLDHGVTRLLLLVSSLQSTIYYYYYYF